MIDVRLLGPALGSWLAAFVLVATTGGAALGTAVLMVGLAAGTMRRRALRDALALTLVAAAAIVLLGSRLRDHDRCDSARAAVVQRAGELVASCRDPDLVAGASAVQVGTATFADPTAAERLLDGLPACLARIGAASVAEILGTLKSNRPGISGN